LAENRRLAEGLGWQRRGERPDRLEEALLSFPDSLPEHQDRRVMGRHFAAKRLFSYRRMNLPSMRGNEQSSDEKEYAMQRYSIALAAAAALLVAGSAAVQAAPTDQPKSQCFRAADIHSSIQATETQLNLKLNDNRYFQIQTKGACFDTLGAPYILKFRGGSDMICHPIDIDLKAGPQGVKQTCFVDKIVPMTKEQILALPRRQQP
jgi:hypothetical protein